MTDITRDCKTLYSSLGSFVSDYDNDKWHSANSSSSQDLLSLTDLIIKVPSRQVVDTIDNTWIRWKRLDKQYLSEQPPAKVKYIGSSSQICAVPRGFDYHSEAPLSEQNLTNLSHPRIPENKKEEYLKELSAIFQSVPRYSKLVHAIDDCGLKSMKLKCAFDKEAPLVAAAAAFQGLERPPYSMLEGSASTITSDTIDAPVSNERLASDTIVVSIAVHSPHSSKQQEIDFLSSATLAQVAAVIFCVQDKARGNMKNEVLGDADKDGGDDAQSSSSSSSSFFFIGGTFFTQDGSSPAAVLRLRGWLDEKHEPNDASPMPVEDGENCPSQGAGVPRPKSGDDGQVPPQSTKRALSTNKRKRGVDSTAATEGAPDSVVGIGVKQVALSKAAKSRREALGLSISQCISISSMSTKLCDVQFQLGRRELYCHHGHCEHILSVSDVRLLNPTVDPFLASAFPRITFQAKVKMRVCEVCEVCCADYVIYGDRLLASPVNFFCRHCHHSLHYSVDGNLLYDFSEYPYIHDG